MYVYRYYLLLRVFLQASHPNNLPSHEPMFFYCLLALPAPEEKKLCVPLKQMSNRPNSQKLKQPKPITSHFSSDKVTQRRYMLILKQPFALNNQSGNKKLNGKY